MPEELLEEYTLPLPIGILIAKHRGGRRQLVIKQNDKEDQVFNFYEPERIYMYGDSETLSIGIAKLEQEPTAIKNKLKQMAASFKKGWKNAQSGK